MKVSDIVGMLQGFELEDNIVLVAVNNKMNVWAIDKTAELLIDMDDVANIVDDLNEVIADATHLHDTVEDVYAEMED